MSKVLDYNGLEHYDEKIKEVISEKSEVSVSNTGTATDEVQYITIDGVEKKIGGGSSLQNILDGNASGSVRTSGSKVESSSYTLGSNAFSEGFSTQASASASHAEGASSIASGGFSHAEGYSTIAKGQASHAEGFGSQAKGSNSHAEGLVTLASGNNQHVQGKYNIEDNTSAFIIGNGTSSARSNVMTVDWQGNQYLSGDIYTNCTDYTTTSTGLNTPRCGGNKVLTNAIFSLDGTELTITTE